MRPAAARIGSQALPAGTGLVEVEDEEAVAAIALIAPGNIDLAAQARGGTVIDGNRERREGNDAERGAGGFYAVNFRRRAVGVLSPDAEQARRRFDRSTVGDGTGQRGERSPSRFAIGFRTDGIKVVVENLRTAVGSRDTGEIATAAHQEPVADETGKRRGDALRLGIIRDRNRLRLGGEGEGKEESEEEERNVSHVVFDLK